MTAEALPSPNESTRRPELTVVPGPGERPEDLDATDQVARYIHSLDNELIPASAAAADEAVKMIRHYDGRVKEAIAVGANTVDDEVAQTLHDIAESGTAIWKLSETEHQDYTSIVHAKKSADLTEAASTYLMDDSRTFGQLKKEARARLALDTELHERETAEAAQRLTEKMTAAGFELGDKPARKATSAEHPATELSDTGIKVDTNGRGHRDHGKFISKKQLEQIEANVDLIHGDQQGTREEYEVQEAKRRAEIDKDIEAKAHKSAFKKGYGSRALERTEGLKTMLEDEAAAEVAAEGKDVAYRNEISMPEGFKAEAWNIMDDDMRRVAVEEWGKMSDNEKSEAFAGEFDFNKPVADMDTATREAYFKNAKEALELQKEEPVRELTAKGLLARTKRIFAKGNKHLARIYTTVGNKIINPFDKELTETQQKRRRALVAVGVGAVAAYSLYAKFHGMEHGGGAATTAAPQPMQPGTELHPKFDSVTLHHGDNIWNIEEARHPHMSEAHIQQLVERDLRTNDLTREDARHLTPGQHIKISHK